MTFLSNNNCMIDLETLGTSVDSCILSIGACLFNQEEITEEFYEEISIPSSLELGMNDINPNTLSWWKEQDIDCPIYGTRILRESLMRLQHLIRRAQQIAGTYVDVWARHPEFDIAILKSAYYKAKFEIPWQYNRVFDMCTVEKIMDLRGDDYIFKTGDYHNALDDAKNQACGLIELNKLAAKLAKTTN